VNSEFPNGERSAGDASWHAGHAHAAPAARRCELRSVHLRETQLLLTLDCSQREWLLDWLRTRACAGTGPARLQRDDNRGDRHMSIKYYTHFVLHERMSSSTREFHGVVELNSAMLCGDSRQAVEVLARTFECKAKDITLLQWSRLH